MSKLYEVPVTITVSGRFWVAAKNFREAKKKTKGLQKEGVLMQETLPEWEELVEVHFEQITAVDPDGNEETVFSDL